MKKPLICFMASLLAVASVMAQVATEAPPQGPRAAALAGTFVAVANDGWAVFHNPAGLARVKSLQAFGSYQVLPVTSLKSAMGGVVYSTQKLLGTEKDYGTIGLFYEGLSSGVDASQSLSGHSETMSTEMAFGLSHGFNVLKDVRSSFALGYNLKLYYLDYGMSAGSDGLGGGGQDLGNTFNVGLDVGFMASLRDRIWIGAYLMNVNQPTVGTTGQQKELPQKLSGAVSYMPYDGVLTAVGIERSIGREARIKAATEIDIYEWKDTQLTGRFGLWSSPNVFTFGFGVRAMGLHCDYSILLHNVLSPTHQFGLLYDFSSK